jgi:protein O-mannosyl-transferase
MNKGKKRRAGPTPASARNAGSFRPAWVSLALALLTLAVFQPVREHAFINFDDPIYITANSRVQGGITTANVAWAFTTLQAGFWQPLTWLSHMLDCAVFGLQPSGHHLTSLLLHTANTVLLFVVLRRMTGATWRSAFVAALFALHPLNVEPVAWAASRKDVLSTFFGLLALWAYARYAEKSTVGRQESGALGQEAAAGGSAAGFISRSLPSASGYYLLTLLFFACGLMSKTMVVTLPLVLLLLDWWPLRRLQRSTLKSLVLEKAPFLALGIVAGLLTLNAEHGIGALSDTVLYPFQFRVANAVLSCAGYLAQAVWPGELAVFYPYPSVFSPLMVGGAALLLILVTALAVRVHRSKPYLAVGWFWYLVTLSPVLGLIQVGAHAHADRYAYIPLIGIFLLLTWGACDLTRRWLHRSAVLSVVGVTVLLFCTVLTTRQLAYWRDSAALFQRALQVTRNNCVAYYCLGLHISDEGRSDEAIADYRLALQINPAYGEAHNNLGVELASRGAIDAAMKCFREAIRTNPRLASAYSNLGMALASQGKEREALQQYQESLRLNSDDARVHSNLANLLARQGRAEEAIAHHREALRLDPNRPEIHFSLGRTLAGQGNHGEAAAQFQEALRLQPNYAPAQRALYALGVQKETLSKTQTGTQEGAGPRKLKAGR